MKTFKIWVSIGLVGCRRETTVEFEDDEVPEDWEYDDDFQKEMFEILSDSGLWEWGFEPTEDQPHE